MSTGYNSNFKEEAAVIAERLKLNEIINHKLLIDVYENKNVGKNVCPRDYDFGLKSLICKDCTLNNGATFNPNHTYNGLRAEIEGVLRGIDKTLSYAQYDKHHPYSTPPDIAKAYVPNDDVNMQEFYTKSINDLLVKDYNLGGTHITAVPILDQIFVAPTNNLFEFCK